MVLKPSNELENQKGVGKAIADIAGQKDTLSPVISINNNLELDQPYFNTRPNPKIRDDINDDFDFEDFFAKHGNSSSGSVADPTFDALLAEMDQEAATTHATKSQPVQSSSGQSVTPLGEYFTDQMLSQPMTFDLAQDMQPNHNWDAFLNKSRIEPYEPNESDDGASSQPFTPAEDVFHSPESQDQGQAPEQTGAGAQLDINEGLLTGPVDAAFEQTVRDLINEGTLPSLDLHVFPPKDLTASTQGTAQSTSYTPEGSPLSSAPETSTLQGSVTNPGVQFPIEITTSADAKRYLEVSQWKPDSDCGVPQNDAEKLPHVEMIRAAMLNTTEAVDTTSNQGKRWMPGSVQKYPQMSIVARSWQILDEMVQLHTHGSTVQTWPWQRRARDSPSIRGKKLGFEQRLHHVCHVLATRKAICSYVLEGQIHVLKALVADPEGRDELAKMYKQNNIARAATLKKAQQIADAAGNSTTPAIMPVTKPFTMMAMHVPQGGSMPPPEIEAVAGNAAGSTSYNRNLHPTPYSSRQASVTDLMAPQPGLSQNTGRPEALRDRRTAPPPISLPQPTQLVGKMLSIPQSAKRIGDKQKDHESMPPSKSPRLTYGSSPSHKHRSMESSEKVRNPDRASFL